MRQSLYDYCIERDQRQLLAQWDNEHNGALTPHTVSFGSHQKAWWRCEKGHRWQALVYSRTGSGTGCPYCAGRKIESAGNSLAAMYPELAAQWHPDRNGGLRPEDISPGVNRKVWWRCEKGHEWQAAVKSRASGCGCPVCANRVLIPGENDFQTTHPELAKQWHPEKNGSLMPGQVFAGSMKKVWWRCEKGHEWQAAIASRTGDAVGCPVCTGKTVVPGENDLGSVFPKIAAQWHPKKNGTLTPQTVSAYSNRRAWWQCELGHEWKAEIGRRTTTNSGCPYCAGRMVLAGFNDLATVEPKIAAQWHPTLNESLTPAMVTVGSHKKVWWQCAQGHVWRAVIYSRAGPQKCGCPVCAGSAKAERRQRYTAALAQQRSNNDVSRI